MFPPRRHKVGTVEMIVKIKYRSFLQWDMQWRVQNRKLTDAFLSGDTFVDSPFP